MSLPLKLLVDVNVWIDYFLERDPETHREAMDFAAAATNSDAVLYTSSASMPDLFFLLCQETKRYLRACGIVVDKGMGAAIRETAWASMRSVMELSLVVPVAQNEAQRALTYRNLHDDFEDDLLLAAAARVGADYVVTSDRALMRHAPVACLAPADMAAYLRSRADVLKEAE